MKRLLLILNFIIFALFTRAQDCASYTFEATSTASWVIYSNAGELIAQGDYPANQSFCLPSGCFDLYMQSTDPAASTLTITLFDASGAEQSIVNEGSGIYFYASISNNPIMGCMNINACNYDSNATCSDYLTCDYSCYGCTNPEAFNFNPSATIDDGTCCTDHWGTFQVAQGLAYISLFADQDFMTGGDNVDYNQFCIKDGCYSYQVYGGDNTALNQAYTITLEDGSLWLSGIIDQISQMNYASLNPTYGCINPYACNYTPEATCNDGSCDLASCYGCTDPLATNYNPNAIYNNGHCCYGEYGFISTSEPSSWSVADANGYIQYGNTPIDSTVCMANGCYYVYAQSSISTSDVQVSITDVNGSTLAQGTFNILNSESLMFNWGTVIPGCTDANACNYNPEANCLASEICDYSCLGCTDSNAANYNANATVDNGTCCYSNWYTIESTAVLDWYVYDGNGNALAEGNSSLISGFCSDQSCFSFSSWIVGTGPYDLTIYAPDGSIYYQVLGNLDPFIDEMLTMDQELGCGDITACNYNPTSTCSLYWLCDYSCQGCTEPTAPNYNPDATVDNGTCCTTENWNTITSPGQFAYNAYNMNTGEYYFNSYPYVQGYCMSTNCYQLDLYSFEENTTNVTISNSLGEVIFSGDVGNFDIVHANIANANEIGGCTDPSACNYNSNATCDVGNCLAYCGGCVDPLALNYNPDADYNDGSCIYNAELPNVGMTLVPDIANNQFYVLVDLSSMGTGGPYGVLSSLNEPATIMSTTGQAIRGPYSCDTEVQLQVHDMGNAMQTVANSPTYSLPCSASVESHPLLKSTPVLYPNPAHDEVQIVGLTKGMSVQVLDIAGRVIYSTQVTSEQQRLNTSSWNAGIYLIRMGQTTLRLVKE